MKLIVEGQWNESEKMIAWNPKFLPRTISLIDERELVIESKFESISRTQADYVLGRQAFALWKRDDFGSLSITIEIERGKVTYLNSWASSDPDWRGAPPSWKY